MEHIVLFKWKPGTSEDTLAAIDREVRALTSSIDVIESLSYGESFSTERSQGFTHGLIVRLPSKDKLDIYRHHPAHVKLLEKYLTANVEKILAVDFESPRIPGAAQK